MPKQRVSAELRQACREAFESATPAIAKLAKGETEDIPPGAQIRAYDSLGKYGIGPQPTLQLDKEEWLKLVAEVSAAYIKQEDYQAWWTEITATFDST